MIKILFVCTGNICRSPLAQGVFTALVEESGEINRYVIDSAGTHANFTGHSPDPHAQTAAAMQGIDISAYRSRQITIADFHYFDHILVADRHNMTIMKELCPADCRHKLEFLMHYAEGEYPEEIPDPYGAGMDRFIDIVDNIERACRGLQARLTAKTA